MDADQLKLRIVRHCLPRWVSYWGAIIVFANATQGEYSAQIVPELTMAEALRRWK